MVVSVSRSYRDAIECLNSIQNIKEDKEPGLSREQKGRKQITNFTKYLHLIGYEPQDLNKLNVIHIAGTKGKGSTCAFTDSIVRSSKPTWNVGLYTSPHMVAVRERIRINGRPLSEELFTKYFFDVWDKLSSREIEQGQKAMPGYFRYLTLLAFHVFIQEKVDATVLEVGVGGAFDSTNVIPKPIVTGITALGLDHVGMLGHTIEEISWHKAGILKANVSAITTTQPDGAMSVITQRAKELNASCLTIATPIPQLHKLRLGISGQHQEQNANLAIYLARSFLKTLDPSFKYDIINEDIPCSFITGLENTKWPGRCQIIHDNSRPGLSWFLDGAHTIESLEFCLDWYIESTSRNPLRIPSPTRSQSESNHQQYRIIKSITNVMWSWFSMSTFQIRQLTEKQPIRILLFYCTKGRPVETLLGAFYSRLSRRLFEERKGEDPTTFFKHVIFSTCTTYADGRSKGDLTAKHNSTLELNTLQELSSTWKILIPSFPAANIHALTSIEQATQMIEKVRQQDSSQKYEVLVTGSLHLVGGVIEMANLADQAL